MRLCCLLFAPVFGCAVLATSSEAQPTAAFSDASPHRSKLFVHQNTHLHYLDWGGTGPVIVLLPGYGLTAHAFDEIGTLLSDRFRVIAVTPRGYGESDAPPDSAVYTVTTMVDDLRALLDEVGIPRAALIGHSISGATITAFARAHADRVSRMVFLDAFPYYAAAGGDSVEALAPVSTPGFSGPMTYTRVRDFLSQYRFSGWSPALEADLRANTLGPELARRQALTGRYIADSRANPPDVSSIRVPALQACAIPTASTEYPWLRQGSKALAGAQRYMIEVLQPFSRTLCARFAQLVPGGRTIEIAGSHYVFFTQPALAARLIRQFLLE